MIPFDSSRLLDARRKLHQESNCSVFPLFISCPLFQIHWCSFQSQWVGSILTRRNTAWFHMKKLKHKKLKWFAPFNSQPNSRLGLQTWVQKWPKVRWHQWWSRWWFDKVLLICNAFQTLGYLLDGLLTRPYKHPAYLSFFALLLFSMTLEAHLLASIFLSWMVLLSSLLQVSLMKKFLQQNAPWEDKMPYLSSQLMSVLQSPWSPPLTPSMSFTVIVMRMTTWWWPTGRIPFIHQVCTKQGMRSW